MSSDEEEWEQVDVENTDFVAANTLKQELSIPEQNISITLNATGKRKRPGITKGQRLLQRYLHQAHLSFLVQHAWFQNRTILDDEELQALALSTVPQRISDALMRPSPSETESDLRRAFRKILGECLEWFYDAFQVDNAIYESRGADISLDSETLVAYLSERRRPNCSIMTSMLFILVCRSLNLETRAVYAFNPIPFTISIANSRNNNSSPSKSKKRKAEAEEATEPVRDKCFPFQVWAEVMFPQDQTWIQVDIENMIVGEVKCEVYGYVLGLEQVTDHLVDLTPRYAAGRKGDMILHLKKHRLENEWIDILDTFAACKLVKKSRYPEARRKENEEMKEQTQKSTKFPSSIGGFLNHPLYVLERHLKKYELVHPTGPEHALGQIRGEVIYPRANVQTLHTADKWLSQEARIVRPSEKPVKHVKSRAVPGNKKKIQFLEERTGKDSDDEDVGSSKRVSDDLVALYGRWQTEPYVPAPIVNGVIPKNKYNNMDLFKPSMLPPGASHITEVLLQSHLIDAMKGENPFENVDVAEVRMPSMKRMARSLGIDFAEAVVGFEVHGGRSVPTINGIVVAQENEAAVRDRYVEDVLKEIERTREHNDKENQKQQKLDTKRAQIKKRLKERYDQTETDDPDDDFVSPEDR